MFMVRLGVMLVSVGATLMVAVPVSAAPPRIVASDAAVAQQAVAAVAGFRTDLQRTLNTYLSTYGDSLTEAECARVTTLIAQSDSDLAAVSTQAESTTRWTNRGNRTKAQQSARSAVRVYESAFARAERTIAEIKPILAPRMGFLEAIEAQSDLDAHMNRYRALGTQLRTVIQAVKT
jgi:succinate dehydrogenase flavin-adding protein (antitoxin of CptAB toxin-antitoxin module)